MELAIYILSFIVLLSAGMNVYYMHLQNKSIDSLKKSNDYSLSSLSRELIQKIGNVKYEMDIIDKDNKIRFTNIFSVMKDQTEIMLLSEKIRKSDSEKIGSILLGTSRLSIALDTFSLQFSEDRTVYNENAKRIEENQKRIIQNGQNVNEKVITVQKQLGIIK